MVGASERASERAGERAVERAVAGAGAGAGEGVTLTLARERAGGRTDELITSNCMAAAEELRCDTEPSML